jgi:hypothetical protein
VFCVTSALLVALDAVRATKGDCSLTDGVGVLASNGRARVADVTDLPNGFWQDVDTAADQAQAEKLVGSFDPLRGSVPTP